MKHLFFLVGSLLVARTAPAQVTFSLGPRVGLNVSTAHLPVPYQGPYTRRAGFEAGLTSNVQFGHFALQPSVLFSQKGYHTTGYAVAPALYGPARYEETVRLNYLTVPLNLAFSLRRDGQGLQAFAGPYVGMLVGGKYTRHLYYTGPPGSASPVVGLSETEYSLPVKASSTFADFDNQYTQRIDGGLQAGVGYRLGGLAVQANYSLGLRNLASAYQNWNGSIYEQTAYYNRAWQLSLSYLVGPKS